MNNTSAFFSVVNGVCVAPENSFCCAVWILECYRSSSASLTLPFLEFTLASQALCILCVSCSWVHSHQLALSGQLASE